LKRNNKRLLLKFYRNAKQNEKRMRIKKRKEKTGKTLDKYKKKTLDKYNEGKNNIMTW